MNKYEEYINTLYQSQNISATPEQKNLCSKDEYKKLVDEVIKVIDNNKDSSFQELRDKLYQQSGVEEAIIDFFYKRKMAPGAVISYGTKNYQERLVIGSRQEVTMENGELVSNVKPMQEDTIFDLASVTKIFTAIATLKAVEQGIIDINEDITKYAPQFENLKGVTVYQLLTFEPIGTSERVDNAKNIEEAEKILFNATLKELPLGANKYNDFAPMILKYVIEGATNRKYEEYMKTEIFDALGLKNTFVKVPEDKIDNVANSNYDGRYYKDGHAIIRSELTPGTSTDAKAVVLGQPKGILSGHAGIFSSSPDMIRFARALVKNELMSNKMRKLLAKTHTGYKYLSPDGKEKYCQYLGMLVYTKNPQKVDSEVSHLLSGEAFASAGWSGTQLTIDPINNINLAFLSNRSHNRMTYIDPSQKDKVKTLEDGKKIITLPNGVEMIDASRYAYDRDDITLKCLRLVYQYKILEDITGYNRDQSIIENTTRRY